MKLQSCQLSGVSLILVGWPVERVAFLDHSVFPLSVSTHIKQHPPKSAAYETPR